MIGLEPFYIRPKDGRTHLSTLFDDDSDVYMKYEEMFVKAVFCCMDESHNSTLYVSELCHYPLLDNLVIEDEIIDASELKHFYIDRMKKCIRMNGRYYNANMMNLYNNIKNNMCLTKNEIDAVVRLKLRNNICYFKLVNPIGFCIDICDDFMIVTLEKMSLESMTKLEELGMDVQHYYG